MLYQPRIRSAGVFQRLVRSPLHDFSVFENDNFIAIANGAQSMSYDEARAAAAPEILIDVFFG
jgi:hypothetical protein